MSICDISVQSSDAPPLLLSSSEEVSKILTARTHLVIQRRVGKLRMKMIEVMGEEDNFARQTANIRLELLEHSPHSGHMSDLAPQLPVPSEAPVDVPSKHLLSQY